MVKLEDFKKLKQSDRIEYLLRRKKLEDDRLYFSWGSFAMTMFALMGFIVLVALGLYQIAGVEPFVKLMNLLPIISKLIAIFIIVGVIFNVMEHLIFKNEKKKLAEEFFKFEVKPRK